MLAELGPPAAYARRFLPDGAGAAPPAPPPNVLTDMARLASGGWKMLPLLVIALGAYFIASCFVLFALWKLATPGDVGLWVGPGPDVNFILGSAEHRAPDMREVLGYTMVPIGLGGGLGIHLLVSTLLRRLLRSRVSRS